MPAFKRYTRKQSRSKNFVAIPFDGNLTLSTLGSGVVLSDNLLSGNLTEDLFGISVDIMAEVVGLAAGEGDPSIIGVSHGDYTDTEIQEALDVVMLGPGNKIEQERARRLVRKVGFLTADGVSQAAMTLIGSGGSRLIRTRLRFVVQSGKNLDIFIQNISGANLTTGASLRYSGTLYGKWIL